jgi:hypothetical protein
MGQTPAPDAAIHDLAVLSLHKAIRRVVARILESPEPLGLVHFREIERWMRIAIALAGAGDRVPYVEVHGLPPVSGLGEPEDLPRIFTVDLTDLLAARAADHLPEALQGEPEALRTFEQEAERLLETETIMLG